MNTIDNLKNLFFIFPVMFYYLIESAIAALFVGVIWRIFLENFVGIPINYFQWVAIIWIIKVIFFDVFKLLAGLSAMNNNNNNNEENQNQ